MAVKTGLDRFLTQHRNRAGKRWGLILHQASVTHNLRSTLSALCETGFRIAALFAPEHGLTGSLQDQVMVPSIRKELGLPVHSLYGQHLEPHDNALKSLDGLIFDLQDIGVRYYTFIWTMALAMKASARHALPFIVLDRPNPLSGKTMEGNVLDPSFASFVGLYPLPVRHGMTCGELALYLNETFHLGAQIEVVRMERWNRDLWFDQTGLPWVMPSPNMPSLDTATVYAGTCLLEATNVSEGRGTTRPFEIIGAPFVDSERLILALQAQKLPGVLFRSCAFQPTFHKWIGETCRGVQIHVTNRLVFKSYLTGLSILSALFRLFPEHFRWRKPPYEYEKKKWPIDILCGTDSIRKAIERGVSPSSFEKEWKGELARFQTVRKRFLLY